LLILVSREHAVLCGDISNCHDMIQEQD
jgi:hypothetical protein